MKTVAIRQGHPLLFRLVGSGRRTLNPETGVRIPEEQIIFHREN